MNELNGARTPPRDRPPGHDGPRAGTRLPAGAIRQLNGIPGPAQRDDAGIRDLRELLWCSIDNDDSRDLDQLTVAETLAGGRRQGAGGGRRRRRAGQEGLADRRARRRPTRPRSTPPPQIFPMLPERLSTDLTSLNEGEDRLAVVVEMVVAADGSVDGVRGLPRAGAQPGQARLRRRRGLARRQRRRCPAKVARSRAWTSSCGSRTGSPRPCGGCRHEHGALELETIEARAVFDGRPGRRPAAGAEEPRQGADRGLHDRRQRRHRARSSRRRGFPACGAWCARRSAGTGSSRSRQGFGEKLPAEPDRRALEAFLARRRRPTRCASPTSRWRSSS